MAREDQIYMNILADEEGLAMGAQSEARYHLSNPYGGNSGYVGYSMSKRAAEAREEGRYPKNDFKKVYDMPQATLDALVKAGVINDKEWHHTSVYGNKTTFYGWGAYGESPYMSEYYKAHKTEIDEAAKNHRDLTPFLDGFEEFEEDVDANNVYVAQLKAQAEAEREAQRREEERLFQERINEEKREREDSERKRAYVEANLPAEFVASNGVTIKPKGYGEYPAYRDGEAITSASSSNKRKAASKARAEFKVQVVTPLEESYVSQSETMYSLSTSNQSAMRYDKVNGTNVKEFFDFLRNGKVFEEGKPVLFHIANAGELLQRYGIKGKFMVGKFTFSKEHTQDEAHNLGVKEWVDVINTINTPLAITTYKGRENEYRIYTYATINGENICVGVNVSLKNQEIELANIISAYGRDINKLLGAESVNLLYPSSIKEVKQRISQVSTGPNSPLNATSSASDSKDTTSIPENQTNGGKFSLRELDAPYLDAVERGDMEAAQRMVLEAAEKAGYINDESWRMSHRAPRKDEENTNPFNTEEIVPEDFWEHPEWYTNIRHSSETRESYYAMKSAIDKYKRLIAEGKTEEAENVTITMYRGVDKTANKREASFRNGDWITPSRSYALLSAPYGKARVISQEVKLKDIWWDGNSINEWGYDDGANYGYRDTKNNRKLLDPVTYDDNGNVIPLSERFNPKKEDIRYSLVAPTNEEVTYNNFMNGTSAIFEQMVEMPARKADYISRSGSRYWYGEDERGKYVIRSSDHWSDVVRNEEDAKAFNAKPDDYNNIASCYWAIDYSKPQEFEPVNAADIRRVDYNSQRHILNIVNNDGTRTSRQGVMPRDMRPYFDAMKDGTKAEAHAYVADMVNDRFHTKPMPRVATAKAYLDDFTKWEVEPRVMQGQPKARAEFKEQIVAPLEEALRAYVNKATLGERSDADSHNSSSEGLPLESSERLSVSPLTSPKDVAKIGKNTEVTHRAAKNITELYTLGV